MTRCISCKTIIVVIFESLVPVAPCVRRGGHGTGGGAAVTGCCNGPIRPRICFPVGSLFGDISSGSPNFSAFFRPHLAVNIQDLQQLPFSLSSGSSRRRRRVPFVFTMAAPAAFSDIAKASNDVCLPEISDCLLLVAEEHCKD